MHPSDKLLLCFEKAGSGPVRLGQTSYCCENALPLAAQRGSYSGTFKWSSGVKALMIFLLRSAAAGIRGNEEDDPYVMRGGRPSPAASLNDLLTKRPIWIYDIFGATADGLPQLVEFVRRQNADFTERQQEVCLWLDPVKFQSGRIEVRLNGRTVEDAAVLDQLADDITGQWKTRRLKQPAAHADPATILQSFQELNLENAAQHFERLFECLDLEVELEAVGLEAVGLAGRWRGREAVINVLGGCFERFAESSRLHTLVSSEEALVVLSHVQLQQDDRVLPFYLTRKFEFREGRIVHILQLAVEMPA